MASIKNLIIETFFPDWKLKDDKSNPILVVLGDFVSNETRPFAGMERSPQKAVLEWFKGDPRFVVVVAEEVYTTRTCSACGRLTLVDSFERHFHREDLKNPGKTLNKKEYGADVVRAIQELKWCVDCEIHWGRDVNAAVNIHRKFMKMLARAAKALTNDNTNNNVQAEAHTH